MVFNVFDFVLEVVFLILMKFLRELVICEFKEEFYDVIMVDDFDDEEDEDEGDEENGLVSKYLVCLLFVFIFFSYDSIFFF